MTQRLELTIAMPFGGGLETVVIDITGLPRVADEIAGRIAHFADELTDLELRHQRGPFPIPNQLEEV